MSAAPTDSPLSLPGNTNGVARARPEPDRVPFGRVYAHDVTQTEAIEQILAQVNARVGGFVVTPNVDHICNAEKDPELRAAYGKAFLALPDGMPLLWMAKGLGLSLREKVSGSDLLLPLLRAAGDQGKRVFFLGSTEDVCAKAAERLRKDMPGLVISGWSCPRFDPNAADTTPMRKAFDDVQAVGADLVLVAFGSPKQEYIMSRFASLYEPAVALGIGASIDFVAGSVKRAPSWMSDRGLEWVYRLVQEPKRLWRRYLINDRAIVSIFLRTRKQVRTSQ